LRHNPQDLPALYNHGGTFTNNLIYNDATRSRTPTLLCCGNQSEISHNTIIQNASTGIVSSHGGTDNGAQVQQNIVCQNRGGNIQLQQAVQRGNITTCPQFVNPGAGDFRVQGGSSAGIQGAVGLGTGQPLATAVLAPPAAPAAVPCRPPSTVTVPPIEVTVPSMQTITIPIPTPQTVAPSIPVNPEVIPKQPHVVGAVPLPTMAVPLPLPPPSARTPPLTMAVPAGPPTTVTVSQLPVTVPGVPCP
jgi:hypothetical protein